MKKILIVFIIIFLIEILLAGTSDSYSIIKENKNYYKLFFSDSGKFLKKEKIEIINEDKQLFENIIPYNWQLGLFGLWQGVYYGVSIANAFNISDTRYKSLITASAPLVLFFTPPLLLKEDINPISVPIVDWGYRIGVGDYFLIRGIISESGLNNTDSLMSVLVGLSEAWGGYHIVKNKNIPRRAGHFYATGTLLGGAWGYGLGSIIDELTNNSDSIRIKLLSIFAGTYATRFLCFKYFSNNSLYWKSFDSYIIAINSIILPAIITDINEDVNMDNVLFYSLLTIGNMANTYLNYYVMDKYDIHFNDGNALLLFAGGILGIGLGQAIVTISESKRMKFTQYSLGMLAGEAIVYSLKKNEIIYNGLKSNMSFYIIPDIKKGVQTSLKFEF